MGTRRWPLAVTLATGIAGLWVGPARAQTGKLTGVVTDARTGTPVEGAQVIVSGTGRRGIAGANGRYFILGLQPRTHTVLVRYTGYRSAEVRNVVVLIDQSRTLDIALARQGTDDGITVVTEPVPLVDPTETGSRTRLRAEEIAVLPVTRLWDVLALLPGFHQLPPNSDIIAYVDTRRNPNTPVRVRGGRADETLALIDGFPINNVVFGGPAFDITTEAIEQIDYQRGGFEAQYGNALSGIVNIATREGGTNFAGDLSYQSSDFAGALGSTPDELAGFRMVQGRFSGAVPGTQEALRFMLAGRWQTGADRVLEFDDEINRPSIAETRRLAPEWGDLIPGWRAFGYDNVRDLTAKLTYYFRPTMKLSGEYVRYARQRMPFDFEYLLTGYDYLQAPGAANNTDSVALGEPSQYYYIRYDTDRNASWARSAVMQGSMRTRREVLLAQWDHMIGDRWRYRVQGGWFRQERHTCNVVQGVCMADRMAHAERTQSGFLRGVPWRPYPASGTDDFFGGETADAYLGQFEVLGQAMDHHTVRFGGLYETSKLQFREWRNVGRADVYVVPSAYEAQPWIGALFVQDRIEYDFFTIRLGLRYDFGRATGQFFTNPLNPTNGTTAREICDGTVPGVSDHPWIDGPLSGFEACHANALLLDSATALAQFDDFTESPSLGRLSPRIGVSLPVSERAHVFFNLGRYSQQPSYNSAYQSSGIGTIAGEAGGNLCDEHAVVPGTVQCLPAIGTWPATYVGNPALGMETTTTYEIGLGAEVADNVALQVVAFGREQSGLVGLRKGGVTERGETAYDWGNTYQANRFDSVYGYWYDYSLMTNRDRAVIRGVEFSVQRRLSDFWGASLNYTISEVAATAAAPDLEFQQQEEEYEPANRVEIPSEVDRPHVLNAAVYFRVGDENVFGHRVLDAIVRNAQLSFTLQAASGIPYTPTLSFWGGPAYRASQNSGRGPPTMRIDAFAARDFRFRELWVGVFLRVLNLFDQQACQQVFTSTGLCDTGTEDRYRVPIRYVWDYNVTSTFYDRPQYVGLRRTISVGVRMGF